ncbi:MAG: (2Fe-2S)-binding protein [Deltaproteobacteria bacterium]|nr:(2Fe-2S)-binding protein [Deltaproteobacteria bacterium]
MAREATAEASATLRVLTNASPDVGDPTICRCMRVQKSTIMRAVAEHHLTSVDAITAWTEAGGACTCCHRVLQRMLAEHHGEGDVRIPAQLCATKIDP